MNATKLSSVARRVVQTRNFSVFESKNRIAEIRQKYYTNPAVGADNPTYLKEPSDKIVFGVALSGMAVGVVCIVKGLFDMSFGINKL